MLDLPHLRSAISASPLHSLLYRKRLENTLREQQQGAEQWQQNNEQSDAAHTTSPDSSSQMTPAMAAALVRLSMANLLNGATQACTAH